MGLTPEEAARLRQLEREAELEAQAEEGRAHADKVRQAQPAPTPRPFSTFRAARDSLGLAATGLINTIEDLGDSLGEATGIGGFAFGSQASNGIVEYQDFQTFNRRGGDSFFGRAGQQDSVTATWRPEQNVGTAERLTREIGSYLIPFVGFSRALGVVRASSTLGRVGLGLAAGAATDFTQADPVAGNMANFLKETFNLDNKALNALVSDPDDSGLEERFKAAAAGAVVGVAADGLLEMGAKAIRAYRELRVSKDEADDIVKVLKEEFALKPSGRPAQAAEEAAAPAAGGAAKAAPKNTAKAAAEEAPTNPDELLSTISKKVEEGTAEATESATSAAQKLWDDPENALGQLGIDPAKIDFSKLEDGESLGRFLARMAELYAGPVATKLGRTGVRVTEAATLRAAQALGSTPETLVELYGKTGNLEANLMAARILVDSHGHKMLAEADEALKELAAGSAGTAWDKFIASFHRQAYFLGAVRGASSEVGRALRSLRFMPKGQAEAVATTALKADAKATDQALLKSQIQEGASTLADRLVTDAEKIAFINDIKKLGGDVGELSRRVRAENLSLGTKVSAIVRETTGTLFSVGTAAMNILSGGLMLGGNALSKFMVGLGKSTLGLANAQMAKEGRAAMLDAWAYSDGIISGFGDAYRATLLLLEREGLAEAALNLDGLGLSGLAKKAAAGAVDATQRLGDNMIERVDIPSQRSIAMNAAATRRFNEYVQSMRGPELWKASLEAFHRIWVRPMVNAAGTAYRAGTILFINSPDQFLGTLATRAGAYSYAVRSAAAEAAEMELEGPALTKFIKARLAQTASDLPMMTADDPLKEGAAWAAAKAGEVERKGVLFQDDLELEWNRKFASIVNRSMESGWGGAAVSYVIPFIRTPLRILERTFIDYTPLGLLSTRLKSAIANGGAERDEALARIAMGTMTMVLGYQLAEDRTIVGYDGGYDGSGRVAGREMYSIRVGDDTVQFNRLDPLGTVLGIGADIRQYFQAIEGLPDAEDKAMELLSAVGLAISANVLSKSWLASLKNLVELAGTGPDPAESVPQAWSKFLGGFADRFIPAAGIQRQIGLSTDPYIKDARSFIERATKTVVGGDSLPPMRDALGRPIEPTSGQRLGGMPFDVQSGDELDQVLEELAFDIQRPSRSIDGVDLTVQQYSRYLELRGQVVKDDSGMTMEENLRDLIAAPGFKTAARAARVAAIKDVMRGYARLAKDQLLREDKDFAFKAVQLETYAQLDLLGKSKEEKDAAVAKLAQELGLTPTE